jgi:hypothetical protein
MGGSFCSRCVLARLGAGRQRIPDGVIGPPRGNHVRRSPFFGFTRPVVERPAMSPLKTTSILAAGALLAAGAAAAQTPYNQTPYNQTPYSSQPQDRTQETFGAILNALFGDRFGVSTSLESEWGRGRRPLFSQRAQFESRLDADVRSGQLNARAADRFRARYGELVDLEARYAADGRITAQERNDLSTRYRDFSQRLEAVSDGDYGQDNRASIADGRAEFERRVDAAVYARRLDRNDGARLKSDYYALVQIESGYLRDGRLTGQERDDLDRRLAALNARVGDGYGNGGGWQDNRGRLDEIERALSRNGSGVGRAEAADIRVEVGDLIRLDAAYARGQPSADDRAYLERRIGELEVRARVRRR